MGPVLPVIMACSVDQTEINREFLLGDLVASMAVFRFRKTRVVT
jgi:hypothetical protein